MKKFTIYLSITLFIIVAGALLGVILTDEAGSALGSKIDQNVGKNDSTFEAELPEAEETYVATLAFTLADSDEYQIMQFMHNMSHQKVAASDKWGAERMDKVTIQELIKVVGSSSMTNKSTLLAILERWEKGDFSQADLDHNNIWNLQGGTIGEATGLLTPEQEQKWIDKNY